MGSTHYFRQPKVKRAPLTTAESSDKLHPVMAMLFVWHSIITKWCWCPASSSLVEWFLNCTETKSVNLFSSLKYAWCWEGSKCMASVIARSQLFRCVPVYCLSWGVSE